MKLSRRNMLAATTGGLVTATAVGHAQNDGAPQPRRPGRGGTDPGPRNLERDLVIRQNAPNNLETPFDRVDSLLTPTELFYNYGSYVVNHPLPIEVFVGDPANGSV